MRRTTAPRPLLPVALPAIAPLLLLVGCGLVGGGSAPPTAAVGDCLDIADLEEQLGGADSGEVREIPTVDCGEEHDAEVLLVYELPDGPPPEKDVIDGVVESQCTPQFRTYLGVDYEASQRFDMFTLYPTPDSWDDGDREVLCIVHTMDGSTVTGSFEGAESGGDDAVRTS